MDDSLEYPDLDEDYPIARRYLQDIGQYLQDSAVEYIYSIKDDKLRDLCWNLRASILAAVGKRPRISSHKFFPEPFYFLEGLSDAETQSGGDQQ